MTLSRTRINLVVIAINEAKESERQALVETFGTLIGLVEITAALAAAARIENLTALLIKTDAEMKKNETVVVKDEMTNADTTQTEEETTTAGGMMTDEEMMTANETMIEDETKTGRTENLETIEEIGMMIEEKTNMTIEEIETKETVIEEGSLETEDLENATLIQIETMIKAGRGKRITNSLLLCYFQFC